MGVKKLERLEELLDKFIVADIKVDQIIKRYLEIDAFIQGELEEKRFMDSCNGIGLK